MKHLIVHYEVNPDKVEIAKSIINEFVTQVKAKEPDTLQYQAFQHNESNTDFTHIMAFKDEKGEEAHRNTSYVKEFVDQLYPLCKKEPEFFELNLIKEK